MTSARTSTLLSLALPIICLTVVFLTGTVGSALAASKTIDLSPGPLELAQAVQQVARHFSLNVFVAPNVTGTVTLAGKGLTAAEALEEVAKQSGSRLLTKGPYFLLLKEADRTRLSDGGPPFKMPIGKALLEPIAMDFVRPPVEEVLTLTARKAGLQVDFLEPIPDRFEFIHVVDMPITKVLRVVANVSNLALTFPKDKGGRVMVVGRRGTGQTGVRP